MTNHIHSKFDAKYAKGSTQYIGDNTLAALDDMEAGVSSFSAEGRANLDARTDIIRKFSVLVKDFLKNSKANIDENAKPYSSNNPIMNKIDAVETSLATIAKEIAEIHGGNKTEFRQKLEKLANSLYDPIDDKGITSEQLAKYDPREPSLEI